MGTAGKKEIILFSATAIILSSIISLIAFKTENSNLSFLTVFTPSVLALIIVIVNKGKKGVYELFVKQTIKQTKFKWLLLSSTGIPLVGLLAVLTTLNFDFSKLDLRTFQLNPQIIIILLIAIGEEYGWRGFLLPRLMQKFNWVYSSVILGLIWGVWHFPAYLIGTGVPAEMNFMVFLIWVILGSLFIGWIYFSTKSVLTSILVHISANAAFNYLYILPEFTGSMITFWYFLFYLSIILIGVLFARKKDLLIPVETKYGK